MITFRIKRIALSITVTHLDMRNIYCWPSKGGSSVLVLS